MSDPTDKAIADYLSRVKGDEFDDAAARSSFWTLAADEALGPFLLGVFRAFGEQAGKMGPDQYIYGYSLMLRDLLKARGQ